MWIFTRAEANSRYLAARSTGFAVTVWNLQPNWFRFESGSVRRVFGGALCSRTLWCAETKLQNPKEKKITDKQAAEFWRRRLMRFLSRCLCVWSVSPQPWFTKESCNMQRRRKQTGASTELALCWHVQQNNLLTRASRSDAHLRIAADLQSVFLPPFTRRKCAQISRTSWEKKKPFFITFS